MKRDLHGVTLKTKMSVSDVGSYSLVVSSRSRSMRVCSPHHFRPGSQCCRKCTTTEPEHDVLSIRYAIGVANAGIDVYWREHCSIPLVSLLVDRTQPRRIMLTRRSGSRGHSNRALFFRRTARCYCNQRVQSLQGVRAKCCSHASDRLLGGRRLKKQVRTSS